MAETNYNKYKILIDPDSKKVQGLKTGDVVRRQYYDAPNLIYSLLIVLETGVEMVGGADSAYFIGALVEGDEPKAGQPLDFVRVTNLFDRERGGALYLTASDSDAPYMDVIDGLGLEQSLLSTEGVQRSEGAFCFSLDKTVSHPDKLIISYKIRASKPLDNVPLTLGYDNETDGTDSIRISTEWEYKLTVITIDFPSQYTRELCIIPSLDSGDWCEIKDLNVVRLSDISNFSKATKARMGRITGVIDPVFGTLDGYGAYFQNLYATRNVNIAGTLTAGDKNGFASTFYVGKIHKNAIPNSLCSAFIGVHPSASSEKSPTGMGDVWRTGQSVAVKVQSADWSKSHTGRTYCFSIWVKSQECAVLSLSQNGYHFKDVPVSGDNIWERVHASFTVRDAGGDQMIIQINSTIAGILISSPQMESGETPSLYQPTDGTLSMVEDYGAWFSKGGIGGTIQNPLLRLNEDGSISSRDGSFVINPDGTGHFASGRFSWGKDTITLRDFTIRWEDLSADARENLKGETGANGKDGVDGETGPQGLPGKDGADGRDGIDANLLDWVQEWNSGKTVIDGSSVITPKIFAGVKNANNTITGVALGQFTLLSRNDAGQFQSESINGIYSFRDGYKTFAIDTTGSVAVGRGDQSIRYNAATGKIEFGSAVAMQWAGATWIDANGIFTGTLSAAAVNAININASQITAGKISAALIDTASLKTELITAANIEALTLNVIRGMIGGWSIDADSIYRGTKNNATNGYTSTNGSITIGSSGIRGFKWRLESTGAGALAGGNIAWDAAGNVTFGQSVTVQWTTPLNDIQYQIDNTVTPRLTQISATGIYTGTLTAAQVNAVGIDATSITTGTLNVGRIAAGSITADKINVSSLQASIVTAAYLEGLALNFAKGSIAGWTIAEDSIHEGTMGTVGTTPIQIRSSSTGSGYWYKGSYKPYGISLLWYQSSNAGHIVFGQVAASGSSVKTGFFGLQMMASDNTEYFCLSANTSLSGSKEVYNRIAGWAFDNQKIWKNNVSLGIDGSIVNGTCWKLNNDGSGRMANGNISWDAAGAVTFSSAVSLNWTYGIDSLTSALGGSSYPKLTYISSSGIYTGILTAAQVNAVAIDASSIITGVLNADRIAAGSITVDKLDVSTLQASLVTASHIEGLTLNYTKGTIGGWTICSDSISTGEGGVYQATAIQIRPTSTGNGYWHNGNFKPAGITLTWQSGSNAGHIVMGQVAASASTVKTGFYGIQMMDYLGYEYFCLSADTSASTRTFHNHIAGWTFDHQQISKNNVCLSGDGSIMNGTKWKLNNDGSGHMASGNISWDASGNVAFDSSVTMKWQYGIDLANDIARCMATGLMLYRAPEFYSYGAVHWNNTTAYLSNVTRTLMYVEDSPNSSKYVMRNTCTGWHNTTVLRAGGFSFVENHSRSNAIFIVRIIARIPVGYDINNYHNSYGIGGKTKWLTSQAGTGEWAEYLCKVTCGSTGVFSTINQFALTGLIAPTLSTPLVWEVAYATVFDITASEKYMTTIDVNGIYTGSIKANQITVDSALVVGGSSYNGSISVRDAGNVVKVTLDRTGITAVGGTIGGWKLTSSSIYSGNVYLTSAGNIYNGSFWKLNSDGSGLLASNNISWTSAGVLTVKNAVIRDATIKGTLRSPFVRVDGSTWIVIGGSGSSADPNRPDAEKYDNICVIAGSDSGGWNLQQPELAWTVDQSGRRLCLTHYRYNNEYVYGTSTFTAPSGKYFFENGTTSSTLKMSREVVELIGYGSSTTFLGWIVLNRRDLGTTSRYGGYTQYLAMGTVTGSSSGCSVKYKTYDGTTITVSRSGTGLYYVYLPWALGADKYMVMLSGIYINTPIYGTIKAQYSSYFLVQTQDDPTANDGSFNFMVISTADFK